MNGKSGRAKGIGIEKGHDFKTLDINTRVGVRPYVNRRFLHY